MNINSSYGRTNNNSLAREAAAATTVHMFICTFSITFFFLKGQFLSVSVYPFFMLGHASNDIKITDDFLLYTAESVIVLNMKIERMVIKTHELPMIPSQCTFDKSSSSINSDISNIGEKWDKLTTYLTVLCHVVELWDS